MSTRRPILERIEQLMRLATSPNENEARTAALLAVQLMRKHGVELSLPQGRATPSRRASPSSSKTKTPGRKSSRRAARRVADPPERIVAPLGGECIHCHQRYRADGPIYWFASGGGMHVRCYEEWLKSQ
jgi:hypothetical protein